MKKHRFIINAVMALLKPMEDVFREALTEIERRGAHRNPQQVFEQVKREIIEQRVTLLAIIDKHKLLASKSAAESTAALFTVDFREGYGTDKICRISFGWVRRGYQPREVWLPCLEAVDLWARGKGCNVMEFSTKRAAWSMQRLLRGTGFYESRSVFERRLGS